MLLPWPLGARSSRPRPSRARAAPCRPRKPRSSRKKKSARSRKCQRKKAGSAQGGRREVAEGGAGRAVDHQRRAAAGGLIDQRAIHPQERRARLIVHGMSEQAERGIGAPMARLRPVASERRGGGGQDLRAVGDQADGEPHRDGTTPRAASPSARRGRRSRGPCAYVRDSRSAGRAAAQGGGQGAAPRGGRTARRIAPGGEGAQQRLAPGRRLVVLHGGEAAAEDVGEVLDPLAQPRRQPGRVLVADVLDPARLRPLLGGHRQLGTFRTVARLHRQPYPQLLRALRERARGAASAYRSRGRPRTRDGSSSAA